MQDYQEQILSRRRLILHTMLSTNHVLYDEAAHFLRQRQEQQFRQLGIGVDCSPVISPVEVRQLILGGVYPSSYSTAALLMAAASGDPYGLYPPEVFVHFTLVTSERASSGTYHITRSAEENSIAYLFHDQASRVSEYARIIGSDICASSLSAKARRLIWMRRCHWSTHSSHPVIRRLDGMFSCAASSSNILFRSYVQRLL